MAKTEGSQAGREEKEQKERERERGKLYPKGSERVGSSEKSFAFTAPKSQGAPFTATGKRGISKSCQPQRRHFTGVANNGSWPSQHGHCQTFVITEIKTFF